MSPGYKQARADSTNLAGSAKSKTTEAGMLRDACNNTAGKVAKGCPISLHLFAMDVQLPAELTLETAVRHTGQGNLSIGLLDSSSNHLFGMLSMPALAEPLR